MVVIVLNLKLTLGRETCAFVYMYRRQLPLAARTLYKVGYLGLNLDRSPTCNPYSADMKRWYKHLLRLLDNRSKLSLTNQLTIYNTAIKPIWSYGLEL